jgi:hypothetical protein
MQSGTITFAQCVELNVIGVTDVLAYTGKPSG